MKVDFYQGLLGVWQRKFQNEKILCYYAIGTNVVLAMCYSPNHPPNHPLPKIDHVNEIIRV